MRTSQRAAAMILAALLVAAPVAGVLPMPAAVSPIGQAEAANESDLTTYNVTDPNNDLTITGSDSYEITEIDSSENARIVKQFQPSYDNIEITYSINVTSLSSYARWFVGISEQNTTALSNKDVVGLGFYSTNGGNELWSYHDGSAGQFSTFNEDTTYYVTQKIKRESGGYQVLRLYSDPARTNLVASTVNNIPSNLQYDYLYSGLNIEVNSGGNLNATVSNWSVTRTDITHSSSSETLYWDQDFTETGEPTSKSLIDDSHLSISHLQAGSNLSYKSDSAGTGYGNATFSFNFTPQYTGDFGRVYVGLFKNDVTGYVGEELHDSFVGLSWGGWGSDNVKFLTGLGNSGISVGTNSTYYAEVELNEHDLVANFSVYDSRSKSNRIHFARQPYDPSTNWDYLAGAVAYGYDGATSGDATGSVTDVRVTRDDQPASGSLDLGSFTEAGDTEDKVDIIANKYIAFDDMGKSDDLRIYKTGQSLGDISGLGILNSSGSTSSAFMFSGYATGSNPITENQAHAGVAFRETNDGEKILAHTSQETARIGISRDRWYRYEVEYDEPSPGNMTVTVYNADVYGGGVVANKTVQYNTSVTYDVRHVGSARNGSAGGDMDGKLLYRGSGGAAAGGDVTGRVVTESGTPIANATVTAYGTTKPTVTDSVEELEKSSRSVPKDWTEQLNSDFSVRNNLLTNGDSAVPIIADDTVNTGALPFWSLDVSQPVWRAVPANEPVTLLTWDPTKGQGLTSGLFQDELDQQLPGARLRESRTITLDRLSASNETVETITLETEQGNRDLYAAQTTLPSGIYRVSLEGSPASYLIKVGSLRGLITDFVDTASGTLTKVDQQVREKIDSGTIVRKRTTTGPDGKFSFALPSNVKAVQLQGLKQPEIQQGTTTVGLGNVTDDYEVRTINGSMWLPTRPRRVEVPSSGVRLTMEEIPASPFAGAEQIDGLLDSIWGQIRNTTMSEAASTLQNPLTNVTRDRLENLDQQLQEMAAENDRLRERMQAILNDGTSDQREVVVNVSDKAASELRERVQSMQQAVTELQGQLDAQPTETDIAEDTISQTFVVDSAVPPDAVTVYADYSNGTSQLISDEYLTVDQSLATNVGLGETEIRIEEYPIGETDPAAVQFRLQVANSDGVGGTVTDPISNPQVGANPPGLEHIAVSSLYPSPNEGVTVDVAPEDDAPFGRVAGGTVIGPDGSTISTNVSGDEISFDTAGQGRHVVKVRYEDTNGNTFVTPIRVVAGNRSLDMPATLRVESAPAGGTFALVGDGLEGGDVITNDARSEVSLTARVPPDGETPDRIKVWASGLQVPTEADVGLSTVDTSGQSIGERVPTTMHLPSVPDEGLLYRQGGGEFEPFPPEGSQYGTWTRDADQATIRTVTSESGTVNIRRDAAPSFIEELWYDTQTAFNDLTA